MKSILLVILSFFIVPKLFAQWNNNIAKVTDNNLKAYNLMGKVKSVEMTKFKMRDKFGEYVKDKITEQSIHVFNNSGLLSEFIFNGNLIKESTKYKYENEKVTLSSYNTKNNELEGVIIRLYNANGILLEEKSYNKNGDIQKRKINLIDEKGNLTESKIVNNEGKITYKKSYHYETNKMICKYDIVGAKSIKNKDIYLYENGKEIESTHFEDEVKKYKYSFKHDNKGNLIEQVLYSVNVSEDYQLLYKYDNWDNEVEQLYKFSNGETKLKTLKYDYDSMGNWIKCIIYENNIQVEVIERKISYN